MPFQPPTHKLNRSGAVVIPAPFRRRLEIDTGDEVTFYIAQGGIVVKPVKTKKKNLPELPAWWKQMQAAVQKTPLAKLSEEEIGQLCQELEERAEKKARQKSDA